MGGSKRAGGGGGSGWDTHPPRVSSKKIGKKMFSAQDGNGTQKNENLWDIITSKNMPPVGFEPTTCRPVVHGSTTHPTHRTA